MTETRDLECKVATVDLGQRLITGLAAAWSPDLVDDQFLPTAFADVTTAPAASVSVLWQHDQSLGPIGVCESIQPTRDGLQVVARLFEGDFCDRILQGARALLQKGSRLGLSVGFRTLRSRYEHRGAKRLRIIEAAKLTEFSLCLPGLQCNPDAQVTAIKRLPAGPAPQTAEDCRAALDQIDASLQLLQWELDQDAAAKRAGVDRELADAERFLAGIDPRYARERARVRGTAAGHQLVAQCRAEGFRAALAAEDAAQQAAARQRFAAWRAGGYHGAMPR